MPDIAVPPSQSAPSTPDALVAAAQMLQSDPARAEMQIRAVLARTPEDPQALLVLAVALRTQARSEEALGVLGGLIERQPDWPMVHYELGLALSAQRAWPAALGALRKAVELEPNLPGSWRALGDALHALGDVDEADLAYERFVQHASSDPLLREAVEALQNGRADIAEAHARLRLQFEPTDIVAARLLADICRHTDRADEAERLLADVVGRARSFWPAQLEYVDALLRQGKFAAALPRLEQLLSTQPDDPTLLQLKVLALAELGDYDAAIAAARGLLARNPAVPTATLQLADLLRITGARDEAVDLYNRLIAADPSCGDAYLALANLKTYRFTEFEVEAMKLALEKKDLGEHSRMTLRFALGLALDQLGRYEEAFQSVATANALKRMQVAFDPEAVEGVVRRSCQQLTGRFFDHGATPPTPARTPIFILGMPRSGSTLVEQILASHSEVEAMGELPIVYRLAGAMTGGQGDAAYPQALGTQDDTAFLNAAAAYWNEAQKHNRHGRARLVDTTPGNFLHVGLIHRLFPQATIIDVRRHPMACGLSNFMHLFRAGHEFSYRLHDLGRYYRAYVQLMAHYDRVLPGRVYRLFYEQLIADPEAQIRALLAHCALDFEIACLSPHTTRRPILSLGAEQVRQPMHREREGHWQHYAAWLGPLSEALGPVRTAYPEVPSDL